MVAIFREDVRDGLDAVGKGLFVISAVLVGTDVILVEAGHHGRARGRADGRGGEGGLVADALGGEFVDVGSSNAFGAVAGEIRGPVLDGDPEDVGALCREERVRKQEKSEKKFVHGIEG